MADLPTLRKHEAALGVIRRVTTDAMNQRNGPRARAMYTNRVEALDYALAHLREEIARAEVCPACGGDGHGADGDFDIGDCGKCHGTGKRPTEVT